MKKFALAIAASLALGSVAQADQNREAFLTDSALIMQVSSPVSDHSIHPNREASLIDSALIGRISAPETVNGVAENREAYMADSSLVARDGVAVEDETTVN